MRRLLLLLAAIGAVVLWRRSSRPQARVEIVFDDGSVLAFDRGVEADDLLNDARELLATLG